jgi:hypothetical protein
LRIVQAVIDTRGQRMSDGGEGFGRGVYDCVQDINKLLPRMNRRYDTMVIVTALAEHVGSALHLLLRRKVCDEHQARQVIRHIEGMAFLRETLKSLRTEEPPDPESDEEPPRS